MKTALLVVFLCGFALFSVHLKTELRRERSPVAALKLKEPIPDFTLTEPGTDPEGRSLWPISSWKKGALRHRLPQLHILADVAPPAIISSFARWLGRTLGKDVDDLAGSISHVPKSRFVES